jgi:hypothetical protein
MDQNNNNLFNFNNQTPQEPPQPAPDEPTIISDGAQVYNTPPQPVEPTYTPPPPPPPYNPMPTVGAQPPKKNRTWIIIAVVAVVLLCCCCLAFAGVWLYNNGDRLLQDYGTILPAVIKTLV